MVEIIEALFPKLRDSNYRVTSQPDARYNCIAWAAGDTRRWWWPERDIENGFWPDSVPFEVTLAAFCALFDSLGYAMCAAEAFEPAFERIAIFAGSDGLPTHAARQLPNGLWTSKLGEGEDIEHDLHHLEGQVYGSVSAVMRRPAAVP
jgi:hypothetical protein